MDTSSGVGSSNTKPKSSNQNIQVYVRVRPLNARERGLRSAEVIDVVSPREIVTRHTFDSKLTKKFTFDRTFGQESKQVEVYSIVVAPLIEEVLSGYNCTVFAYGQTGTGKTHTMVGTECAELKSSWEDDSEIGIIPRALSHLFDELRLMALEFSMRISYLELYNEELCDLLSSDDSTKIRIFDDSTKKGSVIIQGLEEIPVHSKDDVYKLLEKGKERRKTATTLMNAQSSRSHTVFSIQVHIRENSIDGEEMLKIGKLNLVDLAGSENVSKSGNEKGIRVRETVNINQSLLTLGRVITALVERTPHIPYRESKLTRLLQESLGGRTKTSIIATISPGHKDIEETLSTLEYAHRAKNIQNRPEVNQKLTKKTVLKEYTEEIDKLKRDLMAARDRNGIYLAEETFTEMTLKMDSQNRELNEKMLLLKALKDELLNKEKIFNETSLDLVKRTEKLIRTEKHLTEAKGVLQLTKKILNHTKRRYKEKTVLLETHVKTEEELTNQATEILAVADVATNDTQQLHNTIERRKDVDNKIQTVCERFTQRMRNDFKTMDEHFVESHEKHKEYARMIMKEISKSTNIHQKLYNDANARITKITELFEATQVAASTQSEKYVAQMSGLSVEHKILLEKLFAQLQRGQLELQTQLQTNLNDLSAYNEEQRTRVDALRSSVVQMLQDNSNELEAHTIEMRKQIERAASISQTSIQELAQMQQQISSERSLVTEEQTIIDEFMAKMKSIKEKRLCCLDEVNRLATQQEKNHQQILQQCNEQTNVGQTFAQKRRANNIAAEEKFVQQTKESLLCIEQSDAKCLNVQAQLENFTTECGKQIVALADNENSHCQQAQQILSAHESEVKRMRLKNTENFTADSSAMRAELAENSNRLKDTVTVIGSGVGSLQNCMGDYAKLQREDISECVQKVVEFQQNELKTYTPTGATPSKKTFIYPRVLTATSPHNLIVQRFRQENDWSDADTTATTIDEECSEDEEQLNSVQDISDAETILNSTPIDVPKNAVGSNNTSNNSIPNVLKPAQHLRSSSLTRNNTPRKRYSPHGSSSLIKDNKENVS